MLRNLSILILLLALASALQPKELSLEDIVKELRDLTSDANNADSPDLPTDALENSREFPENNFQQLDKTLRQPTSDEMNGVPDTRKDVLDKPSDFNEDYLQPHKNSTVVFSYKQRFFVSISSLPGSFHLVSFNLKKYLIYTYFLQIS